MASKTNEPAIKYLEKLLEDLKEDKCQIQHFFREIIEREEFEGIRATRLESTMLIEVEFLEGRLLEKD